MKRIKELQKYFPGEDAIDVTWYSTTTNTLAYMPLRKPSQKSIKLKYFVGQMYHSFSSLKKNWYWHKKHYKGYQMDSFSCRFIPMEE